MTATRQRWALGCLRALGIFLLLATILIVLLYAEEDWRGARALATAKAKWRTAGYSLNPADYYPPPVPDEKNLAALPLFQLEPDPSTKKLQAKRLTEATNEVEHGGSLYDNDHKQDLAALVGDAFAHKFPGKEAPASALTQIEALYPVIAELRASAQTQPEFRLNEDYGYQPEWDRPLGALTGQLSVARLLAYHAELALRENQPEVALEDISIGFEIARGIAQDPSVVGGLLATADFAITRRNVVGGLEDHAWNDAQLALLLDTMKQLDFLRLFQFDMQVEGAAHSLVLYSNLKAHPSVVARLASRVQLIQDGNYGSEPSPSVSGKLLWCVIAGGWWDMNAARMLDLERRESQSVDINARRVDASVTRQIEAGVELGRELPGGLAPWKIFFGVSAGPMLTTIKQFARAQVELDQDRIVCAVERYRLAHGNYPPALDALAPQFIEAIPHDVMNGEPYHYRLNADGTFVLYSVGWNGTDDGGKMGQNQYVPAMIDFDRGDWVWPMVKR